MAQCLFFYQIKKYVGQRKDDQSTDRKKNIMTGKMSKKIKAPTKKPDVEEYLFTRCLTTGHLAQLNQLTRVVRKRDIQ